MMDTSESSSSTSGYPRRLECRGNPKSQTHPCSTLVHKREVNAIFENSPIEVTNTKERIIYVNEARRYNYPTIVTHPPTSPGMPVSFSEEDSYSVHFLHNDALAVTVHIGC